MPTDPAWLKENRPLRHWLAILSAERRAARNAPPDPIRFTIRDFPPMRAVEPTQHFTKAQRKAHRLAACKPIKSRLYAAQDGRCYLCGWPMGSIRQATEDHVTPKARGGRNAGNVLLSHSACNNGKAAREPYPCEKLYLAMVNLVVIHRARRHVREGFDQAA